MNSALYWAVCFGNTNPTNRTQTYSENALTVCIPVHNTRRMYKQEQEYECTDTFGADMAGKILLNLTQWVSTGEFGSSHSWYSSHCLLVSSRKRKQGVSFRSGIWNYSFSGSQCMMVLLHHACLSSSMDPLTFWLSCELSPSVSLSLPLTLTVEIMSFQVNLHSVLHFLWYMTFLSWM